MKNYKENSNSSEINKRSFGVQYGIDTTAEYDNKKLGEKGYSADESEMRKAPGYNGSVPGVNTPEISLPGIEKKDEVSIPAFNPPVPNRAWTEMRNNLKFEMMTEAEKRDLYGMRNNDF